MQPCRAVPDSASAIMPAVDGMQAKTRDCSRDAIVQRRLTSQTATAPQIATAPAEGQNPRASPQASPRATQKAAFISWPNAPRPSG